METLRFDLGKNEGKLKILNGALARKIHQLS